MKYSLVQNCVQLILVLNDVLIDWCVHAARGNTIAHRAVFGHSQCEILGVRNDTTLAGRVPGKLCAAVCACRCHSTHSLNTGLVCIGFAEIDESDEVHINAIVIILSSGIRDYDFRKFNVRKSVSDIRDVVVIIRSIGKKLAVHRILINSKHIVHQVTVVISYERKQFRDSLSNAA